MGLGEVYQTVATPYLREVRTGGRVSVRDRWDEGLLAFVAVEHVGGSEVREWGRRGRWVLSGVLCGCKE